MRSSFRDQRGNTILFVAIMLAILALIGLAAVEFAGRDLGVSRLHQRQAAVERCTGAARAWILSQFRVGASQEVPAGSRLVVSLDGTNGQDTVTLISGGHFDDTIDPRPTQPPQQLGGAAAPLNDRTAVIATSRGFGGGIYTAVCKDGVGRYPDGGGGRSFEVEFAFQANR